MNKTHFLDSPELAGEIENRLLGMINRVQHVTGVSVQIGLSDVVATSSAYADCLAGARGEKIGQRAARTIRDHLFSSVELGEPATWETPLGRAVGWWVGGQDRGLTRPCTVALLGATRQYVHKLIANGALRGAAWVTADSIVEVMRAKHPHTVAEVVEP